MAIFAPSISANAAVATVATSETTTSATYANLTTTTDTVTVVVGASGSVFIALSSYVLNSGLNGEGYVSVDVSGANTVAASDANGLFYQSYANNAETQMGDSFLMTGLTAGSTTFKMKYRVTAGTGTFKNRRISVIPL